MCEALEARENMAFRGSVSHLVCWERRVQGIVATDAADEDK